MNGFTLTKERTRRYPAKTITDVNYADDIALQTNAPAQAENPATLSGTSRCRHRSLCQCTQKTEYMCFNQIGDISTLNGSSLKLVDKFAYLGSSVSLTETDIDTRLAKAWTAIDSLSVIWKSDLTDKIKCSFFQAADVLILLYGCTTWTLTERMEKSLTATTQECCEQVLEAAPYKAAAVRPPSTHHENYPN